LDLDRAPRRLALDREAREQAGAIVMRALPFTRGLATAVTSMLLLPSLPVTAQVTAKAAGSTRTNLEASAQKKALSS